jgi:hypothetical protein
LQPRQENEYGENIGSISLLLLFKPLKLVDSEKFKKHELIIGAGYSYNSYTMIISRYEINGNDYGLTGFSINQTGHLNPIIVS